MPPCSQVPDAAPPPPAWPAALPLAPESPIPALPPLAPTLAPPEELVPALPEPAAAPPPPAAPPLAAPLDAPSPEAAAAPAAPDTTPAAPDDAAAVPPEADSPAAPAVGWFPELVGGGALLPHPDATRQVKLTQATRRTEPKIPVPLHALWVCPAARDRSERKPAHTIADLFLLRLARSTRGARCKNHWREYCCSRVDRVEYWWRAVERCESRRVVGGSSPTSRVARGAECSPRSDCPARSGQRPRR